MDRVDPKRSWTDYRCQTSQSKRHLSTLS